MATQKPISTVSYNTEAFLKEKLETWLNGHIIQAYQYIYHKGEDGDKDHIHLRIEPNKKLDPMELTEALREWTTDNKKPLGIRPWRPSKEEDWILYAVHDEEYLRLKYGGFEKGEKLPYDWRDIQVPEYYDLETAYIRAKASLKHSQASIVKRIKQGEKPVSLIEQGENAFTVNALLRAVQNNTFSQVCRERDEYFATIEKMTEALEKRGLYFYWDKEKDKYEVREESKMVDYEDMPF